MIKKTPHAAAATILVCHEQGKRRIFVCIAFVVLIGIFVNNFEMFDGNNPGDGGFGEVVEKQKPETTHSISYNYDQKKANTNGEEARKSDDLKQQPQDSTTKVDEKQVAYDIAVRRFQERLKATQPNSNGSEDNSNNAASKTSAITINPLGYQNLQDRYPILPKQPSGKNQVINSIRIPKAGSSTLSVTARALAGCHPDGFPCCTFPGWPEGSCPRHDLQCGPVTGCSGHSPNWDGDEPIITAVRDPAVRLLSAFFYFPPHRPEIDKGHGWKFFFSRHAPQVDHRHDWKFFADTFLPDPTFRNVLTKMMSPSNTYAYEPFNAMEHTVDGAKVNACRTAWFGVVEFPILSALSLYESSSASDYYHGNGGTFSWLIPNPVAFGLPATDDYTLDDEAKKEDDNDETDGLRVNSNKEYTIFKTQTFVRGNGTSLVKKYNAEDYELYDFMRQLLCVRVFSIPGLIDDAIAAKIATKEIDACRDILFHPFGGGGGHENDNAQEENHINKKATMEDLCPSTLFVPKT